MTRRIGEAAQGSGEAAPALRELGVSAAELARMTPDQQLYVLADAFASVESQSERVRLAFKLFDSEGVAMVNMLAGGAAGLRSMTDEAEALGVTLSRVDAAKVEMANDAMFRVDQTSKAFKQHLTTELAPVIAGLAEEFTEVAKAHGGMSQFIGDGLEYMVTGVGFVADAFHGWKIIFAGLDAAWQNLQLGVMVGVQSLVNLLHEVGGTIFEVIISPLQVTLDLAGEVSDEAKRMADSLRSLTDVPPPQLFGDDAIAEQEAKLFESIQNIREVVGQPLPSTAIESWYQENRARFQKLAEEYASGVNRNDPQTLPPVTDPVETSAAVTSFQRETEQIQTEWHRRQQLMADQQNQAVLEEQWRYEDQKSVLAERFEEAYQQAAANQELQNELEAQYFEARTAMWEDHQANLTGIEKKAAEDRSKAQQQQLSSASSLFGSLASISKDFAGEQSGIFKAMFAVSKAFAIAESIVKIQQGIANAAALPFPANIPAMASVAAATASIVSTIKSTDMQVSGARAGGGHVEANGLYQVNERGPEVVTVGDKDYLMVGSQSGRVTPNNALQAAGGTGGYRGPVSVTIYNQGEPVRARGYIDDEDQLRLWLDRVDEDQAARAANGTGAFVETLEASYGLNRKAQR